uniref:Reverse transcriptase Ty1/copia-type domain-containing protein n=1 Tax=Ananas comosus var. bracteatus TaxID=296719 RepID=A0A6V7NY57_ANACO|nr:unnamed protein product [Ananas comosus var. bracteatus]
MALNGMIQPQLPKLTGKNFDYWSIQIKCLFSSQELWDIVKDGFKDVTDSEFKMLAAAKEALKDCRKKDKKALFFLYQAVDEAVFERLSNAKTAKEAWDMLERNNSKNQEKRASDPPTALAPPPSSPSGSSHSSLKESVRRNPPQNITMPVKLKDYIIDDTDNDDDSDLTHYIMFLDCDPLRFDEAAKEEKWRKAMCDEIEAIEKNKTWELTKLPKGQKAIGVKWVYKTKCKQDGSIDRHKARLVVKGYKQKPEVDFHEVFAPVARLELVRLLIALAAQKQWKIHQMDVKSTFLNGFLDEEVYIEQPPGFIQKGEEDKVYKLKKALYGLKQAPRAWYTCIDRYFQKRFNFNTYGVLKHCSFQKAEFRKCPFEHALYIKNNSNGDLLFVSLYVDDLIFTGNNSIMIEELKRA